MGRVCIGKRGKRGEMGSTVGEVVKEVVSLGSARIFWSWAAWTLRWCCPMSEAALVVETRPNARPGKQVVNGGGRARID